MKNNKIFKVAGVIIFALIIAVMPFVGACTGEEAPAPSPSPAPAPAPTPPVPEEVQTWHWNYGYWEPEQSIATFAYQLYFTDRVTELSEGRITWDIYLSETLVPASENYEAVRDGLMVGVCCDAYEGATLKLPTIKQMPFRIKGTDNRSTELELACCQELLAAGLQDYWHSVGVHIVAPHTLPPYNMWTTEGWGPVRTLEDMKGCKVRSPGGYMNACVDAMGGVGVGMTAPESYEALKLGTLDAVSMIESACIASWHHEEVVKYATRIGYAACGIPIGVNYEVWQTLPKDIQDIIEQAGVDSVRSFYAAYANYEQEEANPILEAAGVELINLEPAELEKFKEALSVVWDNWLEENGDLNNGLGKKLWDISKKYYEME